ncbi:hypothetical protein AB6A40_009334 [Gnathostoma spinigerum]|uniref:Uncharacterized protein n=1 Tax=Gnathostoma spinigerum TaxID=75299 RepID=A0ABD6ERN6_9BILA
MSKDYSFSKEFTYSRDDRDKFVSKTREKERPSTESFSNATFADTNVLRKENETDVCFMGLFDVAWSRKMICFRLQRTSELLGGIRLPINNLIVTFGIGNSFSIVAFVAEGNFSYFSSQLQANGLWP